MSFSGALPMIEWRGTKRGERPESKIQRDGEKSGLNRDRKQVWNLCETMSLKAYACLSARNTGDFFACYTIDSIRLQFLYFSVYDKV